MRNASRAAWRANTHSEFRRNRWIGRETGVGDAMRRARARADGERRERDKLGGVVAPRASAGAGAERGMRGSAGGADELETWLGSRPGAVDGTDGSAGGALGVSVEATAPPAGDVVDVVTQGDDSPSTRA